jgi:hypothetical protein
MAGLGRSMNPRVFASLVGPAFRGLVLRHGKRFDHVDMAARHDAHFDWGYSHDQPGMAKIYEAAKRDQWNGSDLPWDIDVDPQNPEAELMPDGLLPLQDIASYRQLGAPQQALQRYALTAWILSQSLHGEQAALLAACQVTESVPWFDGKLYGATQVMDEARHVEVFHRYLDQKLGKLYQVNDNLFTIIDALMTDRRWDLKFLGMQIMIEGLALGAFGTIRQSTREPLLRELLKYVITDEARHVHFGVLALSQHVQTLSEAERREREDWAYEVAVLMRNRFLAHEFYDEYYAHAMSRRAWDDIVLRSVFMERFRQRMFHRLMPNLRRIGLLSDRVRPHYDAMGLLKYEHGKNATELSADDVLAA